MKKFKKIVDERQELEMLRVEHFGFWLMFWLLFASIMIQTGMGASFKEFGFEFGVFMVACIFSLISYLRKGVWDYYTKPCVKTYLLYSIVSTIIFGGIFGVIKYITIDYFKNNMKYLIISVGIYSVFIFILVFITLYLMGNYVIKKRKQLEEEYEE